MGEPLVNLELLGYPTTLGLPRQVYRHAPDALRGGGLIQKLERLGWTVSDLGDLATPPGGMEDSAETRLSKVAEAAERQAEHWLSVHRAGGLMMTMGGDHTTSLGTISALVQMGHDFDVVWIDAHGDFNVLETSPTGNPHGMVLALACGLMPAFVPKLIDPAALKLWGIRELDAGERALLSQHKVEVLDPATTRREWDRLLSRLKPNVFLSFDIDSVEPAEAPGTRTPVPGGFTGREALELVSRISQHRNLLAVDIVEFHPDQDRDSLTVNLAMEVVQVAVAGQSRRLAAARV